VEVEIALIYGLASLVFLGSIFPILKTMRGRTRKSYWILLCIALVFLVLVNSLAAFLAISREFTSIESLIIPTLSLIASILMAIGIVVVVRQTEESIQGQARLETDVETLRLSFDHDPQFFVLKDKEFAYQLVNRAYAKFLGKDQNSLVGKSDFDFFPRSQANLFRQDDELTLSTLQPVIKIEEVRGVEGIRCIRFERIPFQTEAGEVAGLLLVGRDVTDEKNAEEIVFEIQRGLEFLKEAELTLSDQLERSNLLREFLTLAARLADVESGCLWILDEKRNVLTAFHRLGNFPSAGLELVKVGEDLPGLIFETGQTLVVNDFPHWLKRGKSMRETGFTAAAGIPLKYNTSLIGVIGLYKEKQGSSFLDHQIKLLEHLARITIVGLNSLEEAQKNQQSSEEKQQIIARQQQRLRLEHLIANISTHFIGAHFEKIDEGINRSLQTIAKFSGVDRSYVLLLPKDAAGEQPEGFTNWYASDKEAVKARHQELFSDDFQWYLSRLNQLETVYIPWTGSLAPESEEITFLEKRGITGYAAIPLVSNRTLIGYLGFETTKSEIDWSNDILSLFKLVGEMIVYILERKWSYLALRDSQEEVKLQIELLEKRNQEWAQITEMSDLLQACRTADEAYPIIAQFVQRLIPKGSGALYLVHDLQDPAEKVVAWGEAPPGNTESDMIIGECWGVRRGRIYAVQNVRNEPYCSHLKEPLPFAYMCIPLSAQGSVIGVLNLRCGSSEGASPVFDEQEQRLATRIAEYIAITLTNLTLRDNLRSQAIRDPLTGLFNRRYMEETLDREIRRAQRHSTSVGVIMFDLDKMKPINDRFGHDAGDLVLKLLGHELLHTFRGEDVACRYGGDEFTIVLPEAALADVWRRAEQMRDAIKRLKITHEGKDLGAITLSIGVAAFPDHGQSGDRILMACDSALYAAKSEGGDRIMMGRNVEG
jgi:diguanylate cyclase (GGDEF)-like protein/PAS domain S-box-containing protein